jgi:hypothetical protein
VTVPTGRSTNPGRAAEIQIPVGKLVRTRSHPCLDTKLEVPDATTFNTIFGSAFPANPPMALARLLLYYDAFPLLIGERHPGVLGLPLLARFQFLVIESPGRSQVLISGHKQPMSAHDGESENIARCRSVGLLHRQPDDLGQSEDFGSNWRLPQRTMDSRDRRRPRATRW